MGRSAMEGVSDGEWSVFAMKVVEERDALKAENERLREALGRIERHGPPMLASGDYRKGAEDMASTLSAIARAAIEAARKP